jgi:hypothetical protein
MRDYDEWHRAAGRLHRIRRWIDRRANTYDKVVTDAGTGAVVHECHEPLDRHTGHGSARHWMLK